MNDYNGNRLFKVEQKIFYREINAEPRDETLMPDNKERYYSDILSKEKEQNQDTKWLWEP